MHNGSTTNSLTYSYYTYVYHKTIIVIVPIATVCKNSCYLICAARTLIHLLFFIVTSLYRCSYTLCDVLVKSSVLQYD